MFNQLENDSLPLTTKLKISYQLENHYWNSLKPSEKYTVCTLRGSMQMQTDSLAASISSFKQAARIASNHKLSEDYAAAINNVGVIYLYQGELDSARNFLQKSLAASEKLGLKTDAALANLNLGIINYELGNYTLANEHSISALKFYEHLNEPLQIFGCLTNLGMVQLALKDYEKAHAYHRQAYENAKKIGYEKLGASLINIGLTHLRSQQLDSALIYFQKAMVFNQNLISKVQLADNYLHLAEYYLANSTPDSALSYLHKSRIIRTHLGDKNGTSEVYHLLSKCQIHLNQLDSAFIYSKKSLNLAKEIGAKKEQERALKLLIELEAIQGSSHQQIKYLFALDSVQNLLLNEDRLRTISNAEAEFETEKKEQQIALLEKQNELNHSQLKRHNQFIWFTSISLALSLAVIVLLITYFRNKQRNKLLLEIEATKRASADKKAIEKEQELATIRAVIKTRDEERSRISKELHDGINPALAAAKINVAKMNLDTHVVDDLARIANDLRNLSHNLAPVAWAYNTLHENIANFLATFDGLNGLLIHLDLPKNGLPNYPLNVQISLFRMVQELMLNIAKHAEAHNAWFKFYMNQDFFVIDVKDDGKGINCLAPFTGIGLKGIRDRAKLLNGQITISPNQGVGTQVLIKIPLPNGSLK